MLDKNEKYIRKLKEAGDRIDQLIFKEEKAGKIVIFIDPEKEGYIIRCETIIVDKY